MLGEVAAARPEFVVWFNLSTSLRIAPGAPQHIFDETRARLTREYELTLVARPLAEGQPYRFDLGASARGIAAAAGPGWWTKPWIAVYRLRSGSTVDPGSAAPQGDSARNHANRPING